MYPFTCSIISSNMCLMVRSQKSPMLLAAEHTDLEIPSLMRFCVWLQISVAFLPDLEQLLQVSLHDLLWVLSFTLPGPEGGLAHHQEQSSWLILPWNVEEVRSWASSELSRQKIQEEINYVKDQSDISMTAIFFFLHMLPLREMTQFLKLLVSKGLAEPPPPLTPPPFFSSADILCDCFKMPV